MEYLAGLMFGLMLQFSIGPVFFTVLHLSIHKGFLEGIKMTCGVALVDAFYICLAFTSVSVFLNIPHMKIMISFFAMIALIFFGISYIHNAGNKVNGVSAFEGNNFLYGIKMTFTNPLTILFWSGTFGSLIAAHKLIGLASTVLYAAGCVSATLLFLGMTSFIGKYLCNRINTNTLRLFDYAIGIILVILGVKMFLLSLI